MTQTTTITSIKREFNLFPNIVGIVTTANLSTITTSGYFANELDNVELLNNGVWQWENEDLVLIYYATAQIGFFTYDASTQSFVALADNGNLSDTLPSGYIFVGNASNVATGVAMTGDGSMSNTGALTISSIGGESVSLGGALTTHGSVTVSGAYPLTLTLTGSTSVTLPTSGTLLTNTLASGDILVGNGSNIATPVAMSGAGTLSNAGVLTLTANSIDYAQLALDVVQSMTVSLTAAQILGMYATPVQLIAAPGSGKLIIIDDIIWDVAFNTTQFAAGGAIAAQYGNTIHGAGPAASNTLAAATLNAVAASGYLSQAGAGGVLNVASSASLNTAVYLSNATAAFTTGNSTANLYVRYRVITPA